MSNKLKQDQNLAKSKADLILLYYMHTKICKDKTKRYSFNGKC